MIPLWKHQQAAVDFSLPLPATMEAMGMGTGKTAVSLALTDAWNAKRILVLAPSSVVRVWRGQIPKHSARDIHTVILDRGSVRQRTEQADAALRSTGGPVCCVINYEASWRQPFVAWSLSRRWDVTILDESHSCGVASPYGKTGLHVAKLTGISDHRLCLSGTFLKQQPLDAFGQFRYLQPAVFGVEYKPFYRRYAMPSHHRIRKEVALANEMLREYFYGTPYSALAEEAMLEIPEGALPGIRRVKEFNDRIAPITYQCRTEDVLPNLPPLMLEERYGRLGSEARRIYRELEEDFLADLGDGSECSIACHLAKLLRLQQVTSGYLPDDDGRIHRIDRAKADLLRELLEATVGERMVVFGRFHEDLDTVRQVVESLGRRYGEISHRSKSGLTDRGTMADVDVVGCQPGAGSLGIDLTRARYGAIFSPSWSLNQWDQCLKRIHRPPQTKPIVVYRLVLENTVDSLIHSALTARREVIHFVLSALASRKLPAGSTA